jgi:hypothetical protein
MWRLEMVKMVMALLYVPWSLFGCKVTINYLTLFLVLELSYALQVGTFGVIHISKKPQNQQKCIQKGELLLNTFVFFHIAEKVLSFSSLSPVFV